MTVHRILAGAALLGLLGMFGHAQATDLSLETGAQHLGGDDQGAMFSYDSLSLVAFRLGRPFGSGHLSWITGIEYGRTTDTLWPATGWDESSSVDGSSWLDGTLDLLVLDGGIRWSASVFPWFSPYVSVSAKGYAAALQFQDGLTGWTYTADDTQEEPDYEVKPERRFGFSGGGQAMIGARWVFLPRREAPDASVTENSVPPEVTAARSGARPAGPLQACSIDLDLLDEAQGQEVTGSANTWASIEEDQSSNASSGEGGENEENATEQEPAQEEAAEQVQGAGNRSESEDNGNAEAQDKAAAPLPVWGGKPAEQTGQASEAGEQGESATKEGETSSGAANASPAEPTAPVPVWGANPTKGRGPRRHVAARKARTPKPRNWSLGLDTSMGYTLSAPLAFADTGSLSLTGLRFHLGLVLEF